MDVSIFGDALADSLQTYVDDIMEEAANAMGEIAEEIIADSVENYVPVGETGNLRDSKFVDEPIVNGSGIEVVMGFGGPAASYALAVHEHPSEMSPYSWRVKAGRGEPIQWSKPGTGPKYLQIPFYDHTGRLLNTLADRIRRRAGRP